MRLICFILGHKPERLLARLCQGIYQDCGEYHYVCERCDTEVARTIERLYVDGVVKELETVHNA